MRSISTEDRVRWQPSHRSPTSLAAPTPPRRARRTLVPGGQISGEPGGASRPSCLFAGDGLGDVLLGFGDGNLEPGGLGGQRGGLGQLGGQGTCPTAPPPRAARSRPPRNAAAGRPAGGPPGPWPADRGRRRPRRSHSRSRSRDVGRRRRRSAPRVGAGGRSDRPPARRPRTWPRRARLWRFLTSASCGPLRQRVDAVAQLVDGGVVVLDLHQGVERLGHRSPLTLPRRGSPGLRGSSSQPAGRPEGPGQRVVGHGQRRRPR